MNFNEEIVAQAKAFVNARVEGKNARVPAIKFCFWQQFMTTVLHELELVGKV
ncbi:succinate dehydrogenase flavoprotein subunit [Rouxiella silvae]|uniref:succinate dehydrogenase flavoprotein subunit n=1 Tax=Rouxiella silvae TaxID=1646373 RepID=UPI0039F0E854